MVEQDVDDLEAALRHLGSVPPAYFGEPVAGLMRVALELAGVLGRPARLSDADRARIWLAAQRFAVAEPRRPGMDRRALVAGGVVAAMAAAGAVGVGLAVRHARRPVHALG